MNRLRYFFLFVLFASVLSCRKHEPLEVLCDPWLEPFARECLDSLQASDPGFTWHMKVISSEVILAWMRHDYPADLIFYCDADFMSNFPAPETHMQQLVLGSDRLVLLQQTENRNMPWNSACLALAASGTALRRYSESWLQHWPDTLARLPACRVYPEFYAQMYAYMARGWADECLAFGRLASALPALRQAAEGPEIVGLYGLLSTHRGRNATAGDACLRFIAKQKSRALFGKHGLHD